jgi:hypothetical protein
VVKLGGGTSITGFPVGPGTGPVHEILNPVPGVPSPALKPETLIEPYCPPTQGIFVGVKDAVISGGVVMVVVGRLKTQPL